MGVRLVIDEPPVAGTAERPPHPLLTPSLVIRASTAAPAAAPLRAGAVTTR